MTLSRGLTADIQAVIAADYVRNLREECKKGIDGRLKQGLTPWAAPIGYLDQGGGKPPEVSDASNLTLGEMIPKFIELHAKPNTKDWKRTEGVLAASFASCGCNSAIRSRSGGRQGNS